MLNVSCFKFFNNFSNACVILKMLYSQKCAAKDTSLQSLRWTEKNPKKKLKYSEICHFHPIRCQKKDSHLKKKRSWVRKT